MPTPLEQSLLRKATTIGPAPSTAQRVFEGGTDTLLGALGVGPETKSNLVGQLLAASVPLGSLAKGKLAMDKASRMARAAEQGYTMPVYHGTFAPQDFKSFKSPIATTNVQDFGIHVTPDPKTASGVAEAAVRDMVEPNGTSYPTDNSDMPGGRVLPLLAKMNKTLEVPDMNQWHNPNEWQQNLQKQILSGRIKPEDRAVVNQLLEAAANSSIPRSSRGFATSNIPFQQDLKDILQRNGYDSLKYNNFFEGAGEPSYAVLDPRQLRSKFAAFDPAKTNSKDLLASLLAAAGLGTLTNDQGAK